MQLKTPVHMSFLVDSIIEIVIPNISIMTLFIISIVVNLERECFRGAHVI